MMRTFGTFCKNLIKNLEPVLVAGPNFIKEIMKKDPVDMDMSKARKIVYHETEALEGMMIYLGDEQAWYDKGWVSTPAKFDKKDKKAFSPALSTEKSLLAQLSEELEEKRLELEKREKELEATYLELTDREKELAKIDDSTEVQDFKNPEKIDDASDLSGYLNQKYDMKTNFRMGLKKLKEILRGKLDDNSPKDN